MGFLVYNEVVVFVVVVFFFFVTNITKYHHHSKLLILCPNNSSENKDFKNDVLFLKDHGLEQCVFTEVDQLGVLLAKTLEVPGSIP